MTVTPMDIYNKQFKSKMHGYDGAEVNAFLDEVISSYGDALDRIEELEKKQSETNAKLIELESKKDKINDSILAAQESADAIRVKAEADAAKLLAEANQKVAEDNELAKQSDKVEEMKQNIATLQADYDRLRDKVGDFRNKTQMLLQRELEQLDDENWQYWLDQYYGTDRLYPIDGEPIDVNDEQVTDNAGELDSDTDTDVEFNHEEVEQADGQAPEISVDPADVGDGPVIVFPEDYKNHN